MEEGDGDIFLFYDLLKKTKKKQNQKFRVRGLFVLNFLLIRADLLLWKSEG